MSTPFIRCADAALDRAVLKTNVAKVAGGLDQLGIGAGDRVALLLKNSIEFIETSSALGRLGAFSVPLNWNFARDEIVGLLEDCVLMAVFVHEELRDRIPLPWLDRRRVITVGDMQATCEYSDWRDQSPVYGGPDRPAPGSMVYTSGTTGRPKGVKRSPPTPEQQRAMRAMRSRLYRLDSRSRALVPGPLYLALPNQFALHCVLGAEYTEIMPRFDAEQLLATIERERITSVALAPIMFVRLLRLPEEVRGKYDLS